MNIFKKAKIAGIFSIVAFAFLAALTPAAPARAASLWGDSSESIFTDGKARYLGDILTIVINENVTGANTSSTDISQNEKMASNTGTGIIGKFLEAFGITSGDEYKTAGTTTSKGNLVTTISAVVVEVMENGNLAIEARKSVVVNEETQMVILSGVVRTRDVGGDNTILSSKIANAQIKYTGRGPIAKRQHTGILNKVFDWIF